MSTLGSRIKNYEQVSKYKLLPKIPLFIRVDGRAFHTFTKNCNKPFDLTIVSAMAYAAVMTAREMSGFQLAYVQSDEATFMLTDYESHETQGWFDYELNKLVSISASAFTAYFNYQWIRHCTSVGDDYDHKKPAMFDSRAFTVPVEDAPNVFVWRQRDWERNSIQMLARAHFSHSECNNKKVPELHEMLHKKGVNWSELTGQLKNGTFITRDYEMVFDKLNYDQVKELINVASNN